MNYSKQIAFYISNTLQILGRRWHFTLIQILKNFDPFNKFFTKVWVRSPDKVSEVDDGRIQIFWILRFSNVGDSHFVIFPLNATTTFNLTLVNQTIHNVARLTEGIWENFRLSDNKETNSNMATTLQGNL